MSLFYRYDQVQCLVLYLSLDNQSTFSNKRPLHAIYEKLTENFNMFWKTRIFYDSLTANGNKFRTYRINFVNSPHNNFYNIIFFTLKEIKELFLISQYMKRWKNTKNISVKDIFVYCLKNDGNSLHNVTVSWKYRSLLYVIFWLIFKSYLKCTTSSY
jgi:hypothetical protein